MIANFSLQKSVKQEKSPPNMRWGFFLFLPKGSYFIIFIMFLDGLKLKKVYLCT